jgi:alkylation response protein AidB-like acyl-CoA dehydrogenase
MEFRLSDETEALLAEVDAFVEREVRPLERAHPEFFDHRREDARTDWDRGGVPAAAWHALLDEMRDRADEAGLHRLVLPESRGGREIDNLTMAVLREHLASEGPGLHNVLPHEASVVGNFPIAQILLRYGDDSQEAYLEALVEREASCAFGLTEPDHGSDASHLETTARREGDEWVVDGRKQWVTGVDVADHVLVFCRTSGDDGDHRGISGILVPMDAPGVEVERFLWTFNMPTDHAEVVFDEVRVPASNLVGPEGTALRQAQDFVHQGRIRQAAASLGAAQFCIDRAAEYATERETWGEPLAKRQGIQFPLADLACEASMLRSFVRETAWWLDHEDQLDVSDRVSMANYRATRLACDAADFAMQVHGGRGYSREEPFEYIYRHHRRYRITEGTEQIQLRNVAGYLLGFR